MQDNLIVFPEHPPDNTAWLVMPALPVSLTQLVGREHEVMEIQALLSRPDVRLLTLTGTAGVGKTRLALEVAQDLVHAFADGVYVVSLAPINDPDLVIPTIAHSLGLIESGSQSVLELLKLSQRDKQRLLILDNFEQVIVAAPLLTELLESCPDLKFLVTSREVLRLRGEQQFVVPPLALPDPRQHPDVESLTHVPSVNLFLQRARSIQSDFDVTTDNAATIAQICLRLDGLPLAIELAAARIKVLAPQALLARLDSRLHVLTGGARDLPLRQQTLRNTLAWSYELLAKEEQLIFRRLSVFVGGCTWQAIEAVSEDVAKEQTSVLDTMTSLLDKSLLRQTEQEDGEPWFMMLETIREFGLEEISKTGELEATRYAHAAYYLQLAEATAPELRGPQQVVWFRRLEREQDNLRAALSGLLERGEDKESIEMALRLGAALYYFWEVRSHQHEGWTELSRALERSEGVALAVRAKALMAAGDMAYELGHVDRGEELCQQSLALFRESGDLAGVGDALFMLGMASWAKGELATARVHFEESLKISTETGNKNRMAWSLWFLSNVDMLQGDYSQCYSDAEAGLLLFRERGNSRLIAYSLAQIAWGYLWEGDTVKAHPLFEESYALFKEIGDKALARLALWGLGWVAFQQGNIALARSLLEEASTTFQGEESPDNLEIKAWALAHLARVVAFEGDYVTARALYEQCLSIVKQRDFKVWTPFHLEGLAAVVAVQGELPWAARLWGAAEALRNGMGTPIPPAYRADYERPVASARTQLGEQAFAAAWAEGSAMTLEHVLDARWLVKIPEPQPTSQPTVPPQEKSFHSYFNGLTAREVEVLRLLAQGLTSAQIAEQLTLSVLTINTHLRSIYSKLGVTSRSAATRWAMEHHLV